MCNDKMTGSGLLNLEYDFVEYYVGMAKMVVYWHVKALGFEVVAYAGPETGCDDRHSYYLVKNDINIVITSAAKPSSYDIVSFVDLHGNGIKRLGVKVKDVHEFYEQAIENGAIPMQFPHTKSDDQGEVTLGSVKVFDDNQIIFINNDNYNGPFMPGYKPFNDEIVFESEDSYLVGIDHIASVLRVNEIKLWETYLNNIFQSRTVKCFDERQNGAERKIGMYLKVLQTDDKQVNNVLVEPDKNKVTQVQMFIDQNYGAGIQHIAFSSSNIFKSVEVLRKNGVSFSSYPDVYYENLKIKYPYLDVSTMKKHGVLCDVQGDSLLLQVFTQPIGDRPTFFYEIVQRVNKYDGFGLDNINALFEAVESDMKMKNGVDV